MTSILTSNRTYVIAVLWLLTFLLAPFVTFGQEPNANKAIYAQPLASTVVPGEWFLATLKFEGDFGADFGQFTIRLDEQITSVGVKMLGWERIDGEERIVVRLLTDARLQPGLVTVGFVITDQAQSELRLYVTTTATMSLPREFFSAARKSAVGSVALYNAALKDGRVQALQNFQTQKSLKLVAEIYVMALQKAGWTIVQNDVFGSSGYLVARKAGEEASVSLYTDPLNGDRWVTVGVTR